MQTERPTHHRDSSPRLEPGVTLLNGSGPALHWLVATILPRRGPEVFWVDGGNVVSTHALYDLAPSPRALAGLHVARAFTAYQHHALVRELVATVLPRTDLVVLPAFGELYRDDDVPDYERRALYEAGLSICAELADALDVPVLLSEPGHDDDLVALATDYADTEITCHRTEHGLAFHGAGFETLGYWGRGFWQTTIPYWVSLFGAASADASLMPEATVEPATLEV